jgi:YgiT-type zinc finger domain-containing protein
MSQATTSLQLWHEEELLIVRNVPAGICQQCGQSHIAPDIMAKMDQFLKAYHQYQPQGYIQVPEFSASQILGGT